MHNPDSILKNEMHKLLWDFDIQTDCLILARQPDLIILNKKKITCRIMDFAVPTDHRLKLSENKKKDHYLDLAREFKKTVAIILIVIGALGKVIKGLIQGLEDMEIRGRVEIIQTTVLVRSTRILRRVLEIGETCCHSNSNEWPTAKTDMKNPQGVNNNNHILWEMCWKFKFDHTNKLYMHNSTGRRRKWMFYRIF